ncbi:LOW QUALITY PROTEIN: hyaluronidase-4 [Sarcoramphus papa]
MKELPENGTLLCIVHLQPLAWLRIALIWTSLAMKPARPPVWERKPFIAAWRPTDLRYNVVLNLKMFHMIGSPLAKARGQNVTMFYFNRLGYSYTSQEVPVNGGLPNFSLQTHLEETGCDINYYIPAKDFSGLAVIDWEHWRPQWAHNWDAKDVYRKMSRKLITEMEGNISANDVQHLARVSFEESAKAFMKETIALGMKSRPKGLWGYSLYLDCHNHNFRDWNYTGSCPKSEVLRNNELSWLWDSSTALYPSIDVKKPLGNSQNILQFSQFRLNESIRISSMTSQDYALPVFVYTLDYRDEPLLFLSMQDLINTIGDALGAAGIVIWRDMNLTSSESNCTEQQKLVDSELGPYITNVTAAAEVCSTHLCQDNGRVQRTWRASTHLRLNPKSFRIDASEDQGFIVRGEASNEDLEIMAETFVCHCYQRYEGTDCGEVKVADNHPRSSADSLSPRRLAAICLLLLPLMS